MITVERMQSEMEKQVWRFMVSTDTAGSKVELRLHEYYVEKRESKRHKFKRDRSRNYERLLSRNSSLKAADVPLPADVMNQALDELIRCIEIVK
jgi:hypothetical protein